MLSTVAEQRVSPNDGLISSLMSAEVDGQRLSDDEVIASTIITMIGGRETTTNLIASGFLSLLRDPASLEQLRDNPELSNTAVEELLRFESPVQHTARNRAGGHAVEWEDHQEGRQGCGGVVCREPRSKPVLRSGPSQLDSG